MARSLKDEQQEIVKLVMKEIEDKNKNLIEAELSEIKQRLLIVEEALTDKGLEEMKNKLAVLEQIDTRIMELIHRISDLEIFEEEVRDNLGMRKLKTERDI